MVGYLLEVNSSISCFSRDSPTAIQSHCDLLRVEPEELQLDVVDAVRPALPSICQDTLSYWLQGLLH